MKELFEGGLWKLLALLMQPLAQLLHGVDAALDCTFTLLKPFDDLWDKSPTEHELCLCLFTGFLYLIAQPLHSFSSVVFLEHDLHGLAVKNAIVPQ